MTDESNPVEGIKKCLDDIGAYCLDLEAIFRFHEDMYKNSEFGKILESCKTKEELIKKLKDAKNKEDLSSKIFEFECPLCKKENRIAFNQEELNSEIWLFCGSCDFELTIKVKDEGVDLKNVLL